MADIAPQSSPTEGSGNSGVPSTAQSSSRPSPSSSPRTPNNRSILLPVLSEVTPSHAQGSAASRGSPRPAMLDGSHRSRSLGTMPMSPYPPRSAAISSRRGRSRSPTTTAGDRRGSSLSVHSSMGLAMHKNATMVVDHPAEHPTQGPSGDRKIGKQDSRDDEQARAKAVGSGSASPDNISSAAAAAAAVAASFSSNGNGGNGTKRPREDKTSSSVSIRAIPTTGNVCFAQPPQKQGRTGESKTVDEGSHAAWPVSLVHPDKGRTAAPAAASAVTSSSSAASGLSPTKFEEKEQARSKEHGAPKVLTHSLDTPPSSFDGLREKTTTKDDTANSFVTSPLGPPEIQNSHREDQQKSFSPKSFFAVSFLLVLLFSSYLGTICCCIHDIYAHNRSLTNLCYILFVFCHLSAHRMTKQKRQHRDAPMAPIQCHQILPLGVALICLGHSLFSTTRLIVLEASCRTWTLVQ